MQGLPFDLIMEDIIGNKTSDIYVPYDTVYTNYISNAIPVFILSIAVEFTIEKAKLKRFQAKTYRINNAINSMSLGLMQEMIHTAFVNSLLIVPYTYVWNHYALYKMEENWKSWLLCFLMIDFGYYFGLYSCRKFSDVYTIINKLPGLHRWGHENNIGWATHVPHHSSEDFNLTTALRQAEFASVDPPYINIGSLSVCIWLGILFAVCEPASNSKMTGFLGVFTGIMEIIVTESNFRLYQFWIHTQHVGKLGWLEYILVTPSGHRVHHGSNLCYIDKNYGGTLIIWDELFGTFQEEVEVVRYGITNNLQTWNPFVGTIHYWQEMFQASKRLTGLNKLKILWKGPVWMYEIFGKHQPKHKKGFKYDVPVPSLLMYYVAVHFVLAVVQLKLFGMMKKQLDVAEIVGALTYVLITLVDIGILMDKNQMGILVEYVRSLVTLGCVCLILNPVARAVGVLLCILNMCMLKIVQKSISKPKES